MLNILYIIKKSYDQQAEIYDFSETDGILLLINEKHDIIEEM
jgi:hypothetical protein